MGRLRHAYHRDSCDGHHDNSHRNAHLSLSFARATDPRLDVRYLPFYEDDLHVRVKCNLFSPQIHDFLGLTEDCYNLIFRLAKSNGLGSNGWSIRGGGGGAIDSNEASTSFGAGVATDCFTHVPRLIVKVSPCRMPVDAKLPCNVNVLPSTVYVAE